MNDYKFVRFMKSNTANKMYDAILEKRDDRTSRKRVPFGDNKMMNYDDKTGLNAYPNLIHGDEKRRDSYHARHKGFVKPGFFSPGYFSLKYLW
jgi:hypothetical protein